MPFLAEQNGPSFGKLINTGQCNTTLAGRGSEISIGSIITEECRQLISIKWMRDNGVVQA
ncbi:hypothetical protein SAMN04488483_5362 [Pseudomonas helmanticensis]|uniref:Uncharacterized protein n=1 Tax=Pseudomonas helmanticensis TaxID=1471381 RepID=A0ACD2UD96_9PSED|nr:hypothetical protein SAMN04488483_5362 [Pseudomonas helmanticensis]